MKPEAIFILYNNSAGTYAFKIIFKQHTHTIFIYLFFQSINFCDINIFFYICRKRFYANALNQINSMNESGH